MYDSVKEVPTVEEEIAKLNSDIQGLFKEKIEEVISCSSISEIMKEGFKGKVISAITRVYPAVKYRTVELAFKDLVAELTGDEDCPVRLAS